MTLQKSLKGKYSYYSIHEFQNNSVSQINIRGKCPQNCSLTHSSHHVSIPWALSSTSSQHRFSLKVKWRNGIIICSIIMSVQWTTAYLPQIDRNCNFLTGHGNFPLPADHDQLGSIYNRYYYLLLCMLFHFFMFWATMCDPAFLLS